LASSRSALKPISVRLWPPFCLRLRSGPVLRPPAPHSRSIGFTALHFYTAIYGGIITQFYLPPTHKPQAYLSTPVAAIQILACFLNVLTQPVKREWLVAVDVNDN